MTAQNNTWLDDVFSLIMVKERLYHCARCGASSDDKNQTFCFCTDRDTSPQWPEPSWINNLSYPRQQKAVAKAKLLVLERLQQNGVLAKQQGFFMACGAAGIKQNEVLDLWTQCQAELLAITKRWK